MTIAELVARAHSYANRAGFWEGLDPSLTPVMLMKLALVHSEVSEACEAVRMEPWGNIEEELADVVIRVMDLAGAIGMDLEHFIVKKMNANEKRPKKHNKQA